MEKKNTVLCRVAFCQSCYDNKRPQKGQQFLTIGRGKQQYAIREVTLNGRRGFVPHIVERKSSAKAHVTFFSHCSMEGCGAKFEPNEKTGKFKIEVFNEVTKVLPIRDWNAMVNYTRDDSFYLD